MKAYRIYLGARNSSHRTFKSEDIQLLTSILNHHFEGWSVFDSVGMWQGKLEEGKVVTIFVEDSISTAIPASIHTCAEDLRKSFDQYIVMIEKGGDIEYKN